MVEIRLQRGVSLLEVKSSGCVQIRDGGVMLVRV